MTFSDMNTYFGWWYVALVVAVLCCLSVMVAMLLIIPYKSGGREKIIEKGNAAVDQWHVKLLEFISIYFTEPFPEDRLEKFDKKWMDEEKWRESLE